MPLDHMAAVQPANYRIMGPPWWTPFGRYRLVDLSTGRVITRSHDDEDLGRRGERLAYLDRLRCVFENKILEEQF